ncbi:hypothetical protein PFICI_04354 [Pestalotiopsis fici W106-1]|uniref:Heterokaryon incompatibility domain-containing protein n=1 Tax=Pestalotiopsis fici (strain W106-1 / CGMCC3.15140) TaxID=1229662 RepID=W3X8N0_PESFW|nr:uncharacterized protein PFICI_04354 [Pestalotiopsis fici W106-1]ETS82478.1 hypothetical protein PFICI_04354 [Pestalotiopsis fici W106-1]
MDAYQYPPLCKDDSQIRLLTLLPAGKFTDDLQIILSNAQLSRPQSANTLHESAASQENPPSIADHSFTALSYVWGSPGNPSHVVVRGRSKDRIIQVTRNVDTALRHLRTHDKERVLWVDAICINQGDLAERSSQVCLMARIYNRALDVVIWLGPEQDDGEYALSLLGTWGSNVEVDWKVMTMAPSQDAGSETHWADSNHQKTLDERQSLALFRLIHREWFERLWVRQEALTGTPTIIRCGNAEYSSQTLRNAIFMLYTSGVLVHLPTEERTKFADRWSLVYSLVTSFASKRTLEKLRFDLRGLKWGDPVDAIYATLSLLTPFKQAIGIVPDYTLASHGIQKAVVRNTHALDATDGEGTPRIAKAVEIMYNLLPEDLTETYIGGGDICEAYTRTFTADLFADRFIENRRLPSLDQAKTFIRQLKSINDIAAEIASFLETHHVNELRSYVATAMHMFSGRSFFTTDQGYIGLAPCDAKPGDSVNVIIGCKTPMMLRAVEGSDSPQWQIVGACYCPGLMFGEAIYGDLSRNLSPIQHAVAINTYQHSLKDKFSGTVLKNSKHVLEHCKIPVAVVGDNPGRLEVTIEALQEKGIQLETLMIV